MRILGCRASLILVASMGIVAASCCNTPKANCPDLVVASATYDPVARTISVTVKNAGSAASGPSRVYIEINHVGAPNAAKPEAQHAVAFGALAPGATFVVPATPLTAFSARPTIDLASIAAFELVVTVDPKTEVSECDETNNVLTMVF